MPRQATFPPLTLTDPAELRRQLAENPTGTLWVVYVRISRDRVGAGVAVGDQEVSGRELVARLGGIVAGVAVDNDMTADATSRRYRPRPGYIAMCEALRDWPGPAGRPGIVSWHTDRLHRTPREMEDLIDLCESAGIPVQTVRSGPMDLSTPQGRMVARVATAIAKHEGEQRAERVNDRKEANARRGWPAGGGHRAYGWMPDGRTPVPGEQEVIRWVAAQVLAGTRFFDIAKRLNRAGTPTAQGGYWDHTRIRNLITRPRIAGLRVHRGAVVGPAVWEPAVDRQTWEALCAIVAANSAEYRQARQRPARRRYVISGLAMCAECRRSLSHGYRTDRTPLFRCPGTLAGLRRAHMSILAAPLTDYIVGYALTWLSDESVAAALAERRGGNRERIAELTTSITAAEGRLRAVQASMADPDGGAVTELAAAAAELRRGIDADRGRLAGLSACGSPTSVEPAKVYQTWARWAADGEVGKQQALLRQAVGRVLVWPAGRADFSPHRVRILAPGEEE